MRKEEWSAIAVAILLGGMMTLILKDILVDGETIDRGPRYTGPITAFTAIVMVVPVLVIAWRHGHFGDAERNGRTERPFVFWAIFATFSFAAMALFILAVLDFSANGI